MRISAFPIAFFASLFPLTCFAEGNTLTVLDGDSLAPYAIPPHTEGEAPSGAQVDIFQAVFEGSPWRLSFKFVPLARVSTDFEKLKADVASRMTDTAGLKGRYSKKPYIAYEDCIVTLASAQKLASYGALNGKIVVGFQGASQSFGPEFEKFTKNNAGWSEINNQLTQIALLLKGRADAIVADVHITRHKQKNLGEDIDAKLALQPITCNIPFTRGQYKAFFRDQKVADWFDSHFDGVVKSGVYEKIMKKYGMTNGIGK